MNLEHILSPKRLEEYFRDNWDGRSALIEGSRGKFKEWYGIRDFLRTVLDDRNDRLWVTATGTASNECVDVTRERISSGEVIPAVRRGATVCVSQIDLADPRLADICRRTRFGVGYAGEVHINAYLSPPGSGFSPHFDARSIINMQIHGSKRWRFKRTPTVVWPGGNAIVVDGNLRYCDSYQSDWEAEAQIVEEPWEEVVLQPGDVLCMPPGVLHTAKAETLSLALNLHFNSVDVSALLGNILGRELGPQAHWRYLPPLLAERRLYEGLSGLAVPHLRRVLQDAVSTLTRWSESLEDAQELLAAASLEDHGAQRTIPKQQTAASATAVCLAANVSVLRARSEGPLVVLVQGRRITCESTHADIVRECLSEQRVPLAKLDRSFADVGSGRGAIEQLVAIGILEFWP